MTKLSREWPTLTDGQRAEKLSLARSLSRFANTERVAAEEQLRLIVSTLEDEDIYDAIRWGESEYTLQPEEEIYTQLRGFMGDYLLWARIGNAPLGFHFWSGITALGAACQRRIFVPTGRRIHLNFYTILGGHKSTGKGQATDAAFELLDSVNKLMELEANYEIDKVLVLPGDITMESLVTELAKRQAVRNEMNDAGQLMAHISKIDATGIIPLDELSTFFGKEAWAASRRAPFLTSIKESRHYRKATKKDQTEELHNLAVSMLAGCAPDWMHNTIDSDLLGGGFLDRSAWVYREPVWARREQESVVTSQPKDPLRRMVLAQWIVDHISHLPSREPAHLTRGAQLLLHKFYLEVLEKERAAYLLYGADSREKTANRTLWIATQLATLVSLSEEKFPPVRVREEHVALAVEICRLEEASLKVFMEEGSRSKSMYWDSRIMHHLEDCGGCTQYIPMVQHFRKNFNETKDFNAALKNLEDQALIEHVYMGRKEMVRMTAHGCARCGVVEQ